MFMWQTIGNYEFEIDGRCRYALAADAGKDAGAPDARVCGNSVLSRSLP
jgi:hypothetical protein